MPRSRMSYRLYRREGKLAGLTFRIADPRPMSLATPPVVRPATPKGLGSAAAPRALAGVALVLAGAVGGMVAGQAIAGRSAHQTGACMALNMAAALGYLDAEQQRQVRHALVTAINPDADLLSGARPSLQETCSAALGG
jgi:2-methylcitrate dehydratase PrpD